MEAGGLHVNCLVHPIIKMIGLATGSGAACCQSAHPLDGEPYRLGSALRFGVHAGTWDSRSRGPQGPCSRSLAGDGINEAEQPCMQGTLWSFTALCLQPGSCLSLLAAALSLGLMQQPDNEQYISAAGGGGAGEGVSARASRPDLLFLHSQTKQNHWPARVIKDPRVVIETTFGARWLLMHE